jgi:hypothetical protein
MAEESQVIDVVTVDHDNPLSASKDEGKDKDPSKEVWNTRIALR